MVLRLVPKPGGYYGECRFGHIPHVCKVPTIERDLSYLCSGDAYFVEHKIDSNGWSLRSEVLIVREDT